MPNKTTTTAPPDFRFDARTGSYFLRMPNGRWQQLEERKLKNHFQLAGFPVNSYHKSGLTEFEHAMVLAQQNLAIDYAGPLAGHPAGVLACPDGKKVLVTTEANIPQSNKGEAPHFDRFMAELLGEQSHHFLLWLKLARKSLLEESFRPGQMVALAGPSGCGKSLLQSLITSLLGGRMAKPYLYMTGGTAFNSHIAAAEHLVIADEQASLDLRSRRAFGAAIKDMTVNREMSIHAKGRDISVCVCTFRRVSLSVNDEPENLAILPPMDDSILDKISLFKCSPAQLADSPLSIWKSFFPELPAVCHRLEQMRVPPSLADPRYGVKAYHNPELLEIVAEISPEIRLLGLIDQVIFGKRDGAWVGNAIELERDLRNSPFAFAVDKMLSFSGACGTYLSRLKSKFPERFAANKNRGKTVWAIQK